MCVCVCVHVDLVASVRNTSGTGLERGLERGLEGGLERLREWLALWSASKRHVNMVVSTYVTTENGIEPLTYRIEPIAAESYRNEPTKVSEHRYSFLHFFLLLPSFFLAPLLLLSCSTPFQPLSLHFHTRQTSGVEIPSASSSLCRAAFLRGLSSFSTL